MLMAECFRQRIDYLVLIIFTNWGIYVEEIPVSKNRWVIVYKSCVKAVENETFVRKMTRFLRF